MLACKRSSSNTVSNSNNYSSSSNFSSSYLHELHGDQLESLLLESLDDVANQVPVDAVGLDHDEGALIVGGHGGGGGGVVAVEGGEQGGMASRWSQKRD